MQKYAGKLRTVKAKWPRPLLTCRYCHKKVQRIDIHMRKIHQMLKKEAAREMNIALKREKAKRALGPISRPESLNQTDESEHEKSEHDKEPPSANELIEGFSEWMQSLSRGKRTKKTSESYSTCCAKIIVFFGG